MIFTKYALVNYIIYIGLLVIALLAPEIIDKNPSIVLGYQISQIVFLVIFYSLLILTLVSISKYYTIIEKKQTTGLFILFGILGIPGYLIIYFYFKFNTSFIVKTPFLVCNHSAAITAPKANPFLL